MEMNDEEFDQFEGVLRQFQPRQPRRPCPLPERVPARRRIGPRLLSAAAVLLLAFAAVLFRSSGKVSPPPPEVESVVEPESVALGRLTALAVASEGSVGAPPTWYETLLPDVEDPGGGLRQLAKD